MELYTNILHHAIEPLVGQGSTFQSDLFQVGKKLFPDLFLGVYAADKIPRKDGYCIANLDKTGEPGSHWISIVQERGNRFVYDSFGRPTKEIMPKFKNSEDAEYDAEQTADEENCGARCLAWLCVYHLRGSEVALQV